MNNIRRRWVQEEDNIIIQNVQFKSPAQIQKILSSNGYERSVNSVYRRMRKYGYNKNLHWTDEECQIIEQNNSKARRDIQIALFEKGFVRSRRSIAYKIFSMGLCATRYEKWSDAEIKIVRKNHKKKTEDIQKILLKKGYNRTVAAINCVRQRYNIKICEKSDYVLWTDEENAIVEEFLNKPNKVIQMKLNEKGYDKSSRAITYKKHYLKTKKEREGNI